MVRQGFNQKYPAVVARKPGVRLIGGGSAALLRHYFRAVSVRAVPATPGDGSSRERAAEALRRSTGALSSAAMSRMLTDLAWFAELPAESRSWVGQIVQAGIQGFVDWFRLDDDDAWPGDTAAAVFGAAPVVWTEA